MKIEELHIYSKHFQQQKQFFEERLGLPVVELSSDKIQVNLGNAKLILEKDERFKPYHIAFHISAQKEKEAVAWLKEKSIEPLPFKGDPIVDFSSWHAKSVYFYDADRNILELISRKHLFKTDNPGFSVTDFKGITEIGLAVKDVGKTYQTLHRETDLDQYDGDGKKFCPIGDDNGLLITVDQNLKTWFPTQDRSQNAPFKLAFSSKGMLHRMIYDGSELIFTPKTPKEKA